MLMGCRNRRHFFLLGGTWAAKAEVNLMQPSSDLLRKELTLGLHTEGHPLTFSPNASLLLSTWELGNFYRTTTLLPSLSLVTLKKQIPPHRENTRDFEGELVQVPLSY